MTRSVGKVKIELVGDSSDFNAELRKAEAASSRSTNRIRDDFRRTEAAGAGLTKQMKLAGASLIALGAGAALGLAGSVSVIKDFGAAMSTVQAVSGATESQMAALTAEAQRLGATTRYSATQAAEGMIFLARAGFTANEALVAVEGTLRLAQSGGLDLGRAADIASNVLGGFNLNVSETGRVVDVLAKAANSANTDVNQLGEALKFAAPTANALNLGLEETVAIIGKLGDSGLQGGLAGRGFQSFATAFVSKKSEIEAIIGPFNLAEEGLSKLIRRLKEAGIATDDVIKIFRAENLDVFQILANAAYDSEKGVDALRKKLEEASGTAERAAKIMGQNLNGALLGTQSAMEAVILAFGDLFVDDALTAAFTGLAALLRTAAQNADILAISAVALAANALIPLALKAVPGAIASLKTLAATLLFTQSITKTLAASMAVVFNPVTLLIIASAAAYVALARDAAKAKDQLDRVNRTLESSEATLKALDAIIANNSPFQKMAEDAGLAEKAINRAKTSVDGIFKAIKDSTNDIRLEAFADLSRELGLVMADIDELNRERLKAQKRSLEVSPRTGQRTSPNALKNFDESERGKKLEELERRAAALRLKAVPLSKNLFEDDNYDDVVAQTEKVENIEKEILRLRKEGVEAGAKSLEKDLEKEKIILGYLKQKVGIDLARQLAREETASPEVSAKSIAAAQELKERQAEILATAEKEYELSLAKAKGDKDRVAELERIAEIEELTATYIEGNVEATEARARAEREIDEIAKERLATTEREAAMLERIDRFNLNKAERDKKIADEKEKYEAARDEFRDVFGEAVEQAMRDGNVGDAIKSVFADRVAAGMRDALNDLADLIYDLFSDIFKNASAGSSGGGGFGGFFSGLVSGGIGALFGGGSSLVGAAANIAGTGAGNHAKSSSFATVINIAGDASEKTIAIMDEKLAQHRAALPSAIDSRVNDRIKRGAI